MDKQKEKARLEAKWQKWKLQRNRDKMIANRIALARLFDQEPDVVLITELVDLELSGF